MSGVMPDHRAYQLTTQQGAYGWTQGISIKNPTGSLTISNLELAALILGRYTTLYGATNLIHKYMLSYG
jgi:hypothetical protein